MTDLKVNTALVVVKTVPLTRNVARQLDIKVSPTRQEWQRMEFVGRLDGKTLFGNEGNLRYLLAYLDGNAILVPSDGISLSINGLDKLPKLILT